MKTLLIAAVMATVGAAALAGGENFDAAAPGALAEDWTCGVTGKGAPVWKVEANETAPTPPNVLKQSGNGDFPWCAYTPASIADGYVEVKFRPLSGEEDQAGGLMWRWTDGDNYYVARANALENNVSLYHTTQGRRRTIKYVNAPVALNEWHVLRVEFAGEEIDVYLDGVQYIDLSDDNISGAGAVGVWTKADSVTEFDDFAFSAR